MVVSVVVIVVVGLDVSVEVWEEVKEVVFVDVSVEVGLEVLLVVRLVVGVVIWHVANVPSLYDWIAAFIIVVVVVQFSLLPSRRYRVRLVLNPIIVVPRLYS